ncbi:MAG: hypothetical protein U5Q44_08730 [Dehalococcoidia bacterium]|nr:hypothetical protein [Dehalococcoidia bacterium]
MTASATTTVADVSPTGEPKTLGYWRNHDGRWTGENRARIQATDTRYDSDPEDGLLERAEVAVALAPGGGMPDILLKQLMATYFNLAERRVTAAMPVDSDIADRLGIDTVGDAVLLRAPLTLALDVDDARERYSDATDLLDSINNGNDTSGDSGSGFGPPGRGPPSARPGRWTTRRPAWQVGNHRNAAS